MFQSPYVRLLVSDFPACFRFYQETLGLTSNFGSADDVYAHFSMGNHSLALCQREVMAEVVGALASPAAGDSLGKAAVIFMTPDVDIAVKMLSQKDVVIITEPTNRSEWGCRTAHFHDPEGNLIEIYSALTP